jgi:hypothetical protein
MRAGQGEPIEAAELLALAARHQSFAGGWSTGWQRFQAQVRAALPADVCAAAEERGRARELRATLQELQACLQADPKGLRDP